MAHMVTVRRQGNPGQRNPAYFDDYLGRQAGAQRAKSLHQATGISRDTLVRTQAATITNQFDIWWQYEGQKMDIGSKVDNRKAFKVGWKEYAKGKRNPGESIFMPALVEGIGTGAGMAISAGLLAPLVVDRAAKVFKQLGLIRKNPNKFILQDPSQIRVGDYFRVNTPAMSASGWVTKVSRVNVTYKTKYFVTKESPDGWMRDLKVRKGELVGAEVVRGVSTGDPGEE